ncbi:hypothetical protein EII17_12920 [Clostridiales bacterium COT073_COT-073]|nr:hypothetical protein EII17_12920 [Clostridiales bacterium COT073_COT-073]
MKSAKKGLPVSIGIASVWFGAHCGPGVASGNQIGQYYSKFSIYGLFTGLIAMLLLGFCIYYSIEFARVTNTYNFKDFANKFFSPYQVFFANFFDFTYAATVLLVVGSCIATGAKAMENAFGIPVLIGSLILIAITIVLSIFGAELVRSSSTLMTVLILVALGIIIIVGLTSDKSQFAAHWAQTNLPENVPPVSNVSLLSAVWAAVLYAGFQSAGNMANAVSVAEGLKDRADSIKAVVYGIVANVSLIIGVAALLFAYPNILNEFFAAIKGGGSYIPNQKVAEFLGVPFLGTLYVVILLLAIITTLVSFAFAVCNRYGKYIPMQAGVKRDLITLLIMLALCLLVSQLGLNVIVGKGFKYLAYACIAVVILPTIAIGHIKIKNAVKNAK